MSQLKQILLGATKRLLKHTCAQPLTQVDGLRLIQQVPIPTNEHHSHSNQTKANLIATCSKSRAVHGYFQSDSCHPAAIHPKQQQKQLWNPNTFLDNDIQILEKLNQTQLLITPTASPQKRRKGIKRSFTPIIEINDHSYCDELKPPSLKRQHVISNNQNKHHKGRIVLNEKKFSHASTIPTGHEKNEFTNPTTINNTTEES